MVIIKNHQLGGSPQPVIQHDEVRVWTVEHSHQQSSSIPSSLPPDWLSSFSFLPFPNSLSPPYLLPLQKLHCTYYMVQVDPLVTLVTISALRGRDRDTKTTTLLTGGPQPHVNTFSLVSSLLTPLNSRSFSLPGLIPRPRGRRKTRPGYGATHSQRAKKAGRWETRNRALPLLPKIQYLVAKHDCM